MPAELIAVLLVAGPTLLGAFAFFANAGRQEDELARRKYRVGGAVLLSCGVMVSTLAWVITQAGPPPN